MSDIGFVFLLLGLAAAVFSALAYLFGGRNDNETLLILGRRAVYAAGAFVTVSVLILVIALLTHDYSFLYVVNHSSTSTHFLYLVSALWAGNEGSLLFWTWVSVIAAMLVVGKRRTTNQELVPYASVIIMVTISFFLILIIAVADPFKSIPVPPADGLGLNPLLEHPGMVIHPPLLLAGYTLFMVPFAFAIAALIKRRLGKEWISAARNWAVVAWLFLGLGNIIGAWWAYYDLNFGGYWAWDPVENASFMPWLIGTAFLHSILIQRRRGIFKMWSMVLIVTTFFLIIFGTFLSRSNFLSSVHAYGIQALNSYFLVFIAILIIGSIYLLVTRRHELRGEAEVERLISREGTFLITNLLLVGSTIVIFFGTMYPSLTDAFTGNKVEVGASFFTNVNGPLFVAVVLLIGFCTLISWRSMAARRFFARLLWPAVVAAVLTVILGLAWGFNWFSVIGEFFGSLVLMATIAQWLFESREITRATDLPLTASLGRSVSSNRARYGAFIVHFAIAIIALGVISSSMFDAEKSVTLNPGASTNFEGYTFTYNQITARQLSDRTLYTADMTVTKDGKVVTAITPQEVVKGNQLVDKVAIRSSLAKDFYVVLGGWDQSQVATFTIKIIPGMVWIWIGGVIFLLGGLLALWPSAAPARQPVPAPARAAARDRPADLDEEIEKQVAARRARRARFCPQCGTPTGPDDRFCGECGTDLRSSQ
jgi:cytochrome c-type biogenesis protein CcmF